MDRLTTRWVTPSRTSLCSMPLNLGCRGSFGTERIGAPVTRPGGLLRQRTSPSRSYSSGAVCRRANLRTPFFENGEQITAEVTCADPLARDGGVVDDGGPCFSLYGPARFWRSVGDAGHGGHCIGRRVHRFGLGWGDASKCRPTANMMWPRIRSRRTHYSRPTCEYGTQAEDNSAPPGRQRHRLDEPRPLSVCSRRLVFCRCV